MAITAALVKELRDSTGAGMMDAKKALTETNGDMEAAVDWLRTKGLAKATPRLIKATPNKACRPNFSSNHHQACKATTGGTR